MLVLKKVAITGGIACGKSSVCRLFQELGAFCVSADSIVHNLLIPTTKLGQQVINLLGPDVITNEKFNRTKIATKVFNDPSLLKRYEKLLHPAVLREINRQYRQAVVSNAKIFVAEVPLLFEANYERFFDYTIAVIAPYETSVQRFAKNKEALEYSESDFLSRSRYQLSNEEKAARATYVINNDGSLEQLRIKVNDLFIQINHNVI